jgi:hypothetical protein
VFRRQAAHRLARAVEAAENVDCEHALQARRVHLVDAGRLVDHAGVVDQAGQPRQLAVDALEHGRHLGRIGHVGLHGQRLAAGGADACDQRVGCRGVARVVDGDRPACCASCQAAAAPMPRLPPVTSTVLGSFFIAAS